MSQVPYEELQRIDRPASWPRRASTPAQNLRSDLKLNKPELKVDIDRDKVADIGVNVEPSAARWRPAGRPPGHALQARGQAVRRHRAGPATATRQPADITDIYVRGHDGEMIQLSNLVDVREAVAPKELNHFNRLRAVTSPARWRPATRWARRSPSWTPRRRRVAAADGADRPRRPVARVPRVGQGALLHLRAGAALHLSGAGGAVRELRRPVRHHADGAAGDDRRAVRAVADRRHAEHLQPDRPGDAGRPDHQARDPDRRVRQPAARPGARHDARR